MEDMTAEVEAPGGFRAKLSGIDSKLVLLLLLIMTVLGSAAYQWNEDRIASRIWRSDSIERDNITQSLLVTVITNQAALTKIVNDSSMANANNISEVTFLLSLPQEKREALKLEMPRSLREKLNAGK